tara:strand:- start:1136 stop:1312 length:177 start_codon:yes stop_codon:yes gene_type:complete
MITDKIGWGVYVRGGHGMSQDTWCETKEDALIVMQEWKEEHPNIETSLIKTDDNQNEW